MNIVEPDSKALRFVNLHHLFETYLCFDTAMEGLFYAVEIQQQQKNYYMQARSTLRADLDKHKHLIEQEDK